MSVIIAVTVGIFLLLFLVGKCSSDSASTDTAAVEPLNVSTTAEGALAAADKALGEAEAATDKASDESASSWSYSTDEDKVRGGISYYASTTSTNSVYQDSPYESDTRMRMTVRQAPEYGTDVILTVSSGQMMCPSYQGCRGTVRFDDGPAERISFNGPADNSSETIFIEGAKSFVSKLKKAKRIVVEKTLYQAGNPQFEFDVSGLEWPPKKQAPAIPGPDAKCDPKLAKSVGLTC